MCIGNNEAAALRRQMLLRFQTDADFTSNDVGSTFTEDEAQAQAQTGMDILGRTPPAARRVALAAPAWSVWLEGAAGSALAAHEAKAAGDAEHSIHSLSFDPRALRDPNDELHCVNAIFQALGLGTAASMTLARAGRGAYVAGGTAAVLLAQKKAPLLSSPPSSSPAYHTWTHAVDVLQAAWLLVRDAPLARNDKLAVCVAALFHDAQHPGRNNTFLRATSSDLVARYGGESTLEHLHWSVAESYLRAPALVSQLPVAACPEQYARFLGKVKMLILATDMGKHKDVEREVAALADRMEPSSTGHGLGEADVEVLMKALIKMADISNVARPWPISRTWSKAVLDELLAQGDEERARGLEVSPFCDRTKVTSVAHSALGFLDFCALPFAVHVARVSKAAGLMLAEAQKNRAHWLGERGGAAGSTPTTTDTTKP